MAHVRFLASTRDPRAGQEGIVYGRDHETDFQQEDTDFVIQCWREGRVEVLDWSGITPPGQQTPPPEEAPPA
jgi:hypothetical protein